MFLMAWLKACEGAKSQRLLTQGPLDTNALCSFTKLRPGTFMSNSHATLSTASRDCRLLLAYPLGPLSMISLWLALRALRLHTGDLEACGSLKFKVILGCIALKASS